MRLGDWRKKRFRDEKSGFYFGYIEFEMLVQYNLGMYEIPVLVL